MVNKKLVQIVKFLYLQYYRCLFGPFKFFFSSSAIGASVRTKTMPEKKKGSDNDNEEARAARATKAVLPPLLPSY